VLGASPLPGCSGRPPRTPTTSTPGAGRLLPAHAGSGEAPSSLPRVLCCSAPGSAELCQRRSSAPPACTRCRFGPLALPAPGAVRSSTHSTHGHGDGCGASPAGPPAGAAGPRRVVARPQEQPPGSPRLSAAPSLQLVRSAGVLLPRYGFGFNNS